MSQREGGYTSKLDTTGMQKRAEEFTYERGYDRAVREQRPEVLRTIEYIRQSINWEVLIPILKKRLSAAGVLSERFNISPLEEYMSVRPAIGYTALYHIGSNRISFNSHDNQFMTATRLLQKTGSIPRLLLMRIQLLMIHEICHAISENFIASHTINNTQVLSQAKTGYAHVFSVRQIPSHGARPDKEGGFTFHEALNEAVTQRLAEEIMVEYAREEDVRHGEHFVASFIEQAGKNMSPYSIFANQLNNICAAIAREYGQNPEHIWERFKQAYFKNPESFLAETQSVLEHIYGSDFWKKYRALGNQSRMRDVAHFDISYGFTHPLEYSAKWIAQLGIEKNK